MDSLRIEDAKPEDVEAMRAIVKYWWTELYPNEQYGITKEDLIAIDWFNPEYLEKRRREIAENIDAIHNFVLRDGKNEVVGFCIVSKHENCGEIEAVYLIKGLEGKGLGKKLMQKGLEWLGGEKDIKLNVVKYNFHAIEFYKKMGFYETTNKVVWDGTKLPSGKEIPRIEMLRPKR